MGVLCTKKYNGKVRVAQVMEVEREYGGHGRPCSDWRQMRRERAEELRSQRLGKWRLTSWTGYRQQTKTPQLTLLLSLLHSSLSFSSHLWDREHIVLLHSLICFQESQLMLWFLSAKSMRGSGILQLSPTFWEPKSAAPRDFTQHKLSFFYITSLSRRTGRMAQHFFNALFIHCQAQEPTEEPFVQTSLHPVCFTAERTFFLQV